MDAYGIAVAAGLATLNLAAGLACAVPVAGALRRADGAALSGFGCYAVVVAAYFVECVALAMGMGIPVLNVGLAAVWGAILGVRLKSQTSSHEAVRAATLFALYSSIPAASMVIVPLVAAIAGWHIAGAEDGARFGIPSFLPWPAHTILGFYATLAAGAVALKVAITAGAARALAGHAARRGT
jgi:hypothetical protein